MWRRASVFYGAGLGCFGLGILLLLLLLFLVLAFPEPHHQGGDADQQDRAFEDEDKRDRQPERAAVGSGANPFQLGVEDDVGSELDGAGLPGNADGAEEILLANFAIQVTVHYTAGLLECLGTEIQFLPVTGGLGLSVGVAHAGKRVAEPLRFGLLGFGFGHLAVSRGLLGLAFRRRDALLAEALGNLQVGALSLRQVAADFREERCFGVAVVQFAEGDHRRAHGHGETEEVEAGDRPSLVASPEGHLKHQADEVLEGRHRRDAAGDADEVAMPARLLGPERHAHHDRHKDAAEAEEDLGDPLRERGFSPLLLGIRERRDEQGDVRDADLGQHPRGALEAEAGQELREDREEQEAGERDDDVREELEAGEREREHEGEEGESGDEAGLEAAHDPLDELLARLPTGLQFDLGLAALISLVGLSRLVRELILVLHRLALSLSRLASEGRLVGALLALPLGLQLGGQIGGFGLTPEVLLVREFGRLLLELCDAEGVHSLHLVGELLDATIPAGQSGGTGLEHAVEAVDLALAGLGDRLGLGLGGLERTDVRAHRPHLGVLVSDLGPERDQRGLLLGDDRSELLAVCEQLIAIHVLDARVGAGHVDDTHGSDLLLN